VCAPVVGLRSRSDNHARCQHLPTIFTFPAPPPALNTRRSGLPLAFAELPSKPPRPGHICFSRFPSMFPISSFQCHVCDGALSALSCCPYVRIPHTWMVVLLCHFICGGRPCPLPHAACISVVFIGDWPGHIVAVCTESCPASPNYQACNKEASSNCTPRTHLHYTPPSCPPICSPTHEALKRLSYPARIISFVRGTTPRLTRDIYVK